MKNKLKKLTGFFLAAVMTLVALPIQTLASEWGVGDNVYAAMLGDYIGSDGGTYGDKRNYTYIYYKSDGSTGTATRYASTHAKLGVSKNGVTQEARECCNTRRNSPLVYISDLTAIFPDESAVIGFSLFYIRLLSLRK